MAQSDIPTKTYFGLNLLGTYVLNFERLGVLWDSIGHSSKKLLSFEFAQSIRSQFRASWYITGLIRTSDKRVIRD